MPRAATPWAPEEAVRHNLLEFAELFLFLLAAMTYINTMDERGVFDVLRAWLVSRGFSYRQIFWLTGTIAFFLSPIADNLTTALLMATVIIAIGGTQQRFALAACVNVVVAANAGGAFSPFGDITTLMVWQKGIIAFEEFFVLFLPLAGELAGARRHHELGHSCRSARPFGRTCDTPTRCSDRCWPVHRDGGDGGCGSQFPPPCRPFSA